MSALSIKKTQSSLTSTRVEFDEVVESSLKKAGLWKEVSVTGCCPGFPADSLFSSR